MTVPATIGSPWPHRRRQAVQAARVTALEAALGSGAATGPSRMLDATDPAVAWLLLAVITARTPSDIAIARAVRSARLDGTAGVLADAVDRAANPSRDLAGDDDRVGGVPGLLRWPEVEIVIDRPVVDVTCLVSRDWHDATDTRDRVRRLVTGWQAHHDPLLVQWTNHGRTLRRLAPEALSIDADRSGRSWSRWREAPEPAIVPHACTVVVPALPRSRNEMTSLVAMARRSSNELVAVSEGCGALFAAAGASDLAPELRAEAVAQGLAVCRDAVRVAALSPAAGADLTAWKEILAATERSGPDVQVFARPQAAAQRSISTVAAPEGASSAGSTTWDEHADALWAYLVG